MTAEYLACGECSSPVRKEFWNRENGFRCPGCGRNVQAVVFPAIGHAPPLALPEAVASEGEASCFYHPQSRAAAPCDDCGRFLCRLCDLEIDGHHHCPRCFQSGLSTRKLENVESRRTMYDSIALALATLPALLFWPVVFTAPAALYVVVRRWREPGSLVPRTKVRFVLAALFALAEIAGVGFALWALIQLPRRTVAP
jgi:DNA-directed RNA polymerase subunit RPC12/RpoP